MSRAYEWYLRAKREMLRFTKEGLDRAIEFLGQCEAITGENALVLAVKGEAYWQYVNSGVSGDPSYLDKAEACVRRVLEINPQSPHGHRVAGLVRVHRGDIQGALAELKVALDLAPNDPDCLLWGCLVGGLSGKMALAETWAARLVEVDPMTPFYQLMPGTMAWMRGDYERAWALWSARLAAVMENPLMRLCYGHVAVITGRAAEGHRILEELAQAVPDNPFGQLAVVYQRALAGDRAAGAGAADAGTGRRARRRPAILLVPRPVSRVGGRHRRRVALDRSGDRAGLHQSRSAGAERSVPRQPAVRSALRRVDGTSAAAIGRARDLIGAPLSA